MKEEILRLIRQGKPWNKIVKELSCPKNEVVSVFHSTLTHICPSCDSAIEYKNWKCAINAIRKKSTCASCRAKKSTKVFCSTERTCPQCKKIVKHSNKYDCQRAIEKNSVCGECRYKNITTLSCGLQRNCPECNKILIYKSQSNCNKSSNSLCRNCTKKKHTGAKNGFYGKKHSECTKNKIRITRKKIGNGPWQTKEYRDKISKLTSGRNNPRFNKANNYDLWIQKYGKEEADRKLASMKMKKSISSKGKNNPMYGKTAPRGSGNGWKGWYKGWFFRSLKELSYMVNVIEKQGLKWKSAESKELTIPYVNWDGSERTYRADFLLEDKYLVEIKPSKLKNSVVVNLKKTAAEDFCLKKGLAYKIEDCDLLPTKIIKNLRETGILKFTDRYESKFIAFISSRAKKKLPDI